MRRKLAPTPQIAPRAGKTRVLTDGRGVSVGLALAGANHPDFQLLEETLASVPVPRPQPTEAAPVHLCADKGYDYPTVEAHVVQEGFTPHTPLRGTAPQAHARNPEKRHAAGWSNAPLTGSTTGVTSFSAGIV